MKKVINTIPDIYLLFNTNAPCFNICYNVKSFQGLFLYIKSYYTIFSYIMQNNFKNLEIEEIERIPIDKMKNILNTVLNCTYGELYIVSKAASDILKNIIINNKNNIKIKKLANKILNVLNGLNRLLDELQNKQNFNDEKSGNIGLINNVGEKETMVCRICDRKITVDLFQEHVHFCGIEAQAELKIKKIQKKLNLIQNNICENILNTKWPGDSLNVLINKLPIFIVSLLIEKTSNEPLFSKKLLKYLEDDVQTISSFLVNNKEFHTILFKARKVLIKKRKYVFLIQEAHEHILKTILKNESDDEVLRIKISDFEFIKKISSGAYAQVYLARKKTTDDIYAIKVISKNDIILKNLVKRVIIERDILLRSKNPYIINFCMYIFHYNHKSFLL